MPKGNSAIGTIGTADSHRAGQYIGRFAPSPTGPLHFGSLIAATASYLEARHHSGKWLVRIEDIDPPREKPGSATLILHTLEKFGFEWDESPSFQSQNRRYQDDAIEFLVARDQAYRCGCSRSDLAAAPQGPLGTIYPGTCRSGFSGSRFAIRVRTTGDPLEFRDALQGHQCQRLESDSGDFIILRRDGLIAYQLAVVVDDQLQGVTDIVRGIDLMDSTLRQIWLQRLLGYSTPRYAHIPVAVNRAGQKLSKNTGAPPILSTDVRPVLVKALSALGQNPPSGLLDSSLEDLWSWARQNWSIAAMAGQASIPIADGTLAGTKNGLR